MDRDYLQHLEASPYINEAFPKGFKSNLSALGQKLAGVFGKRPPEKAAPGAVPPVIPKTPASKPAPSGSPQATAKDFVALVNAVLGIINNRVMKDEPHSKAYFAKSQDGGYYLPKTWDEPAPTEPEWKNVPADEKDPLKKAAMKKGPHYVQDPTTGQWKYVDPAKPLEEQDPAAPEPTTEPEIEKTGNFVQDFAGLYNKHPGSYTIEVTEGGGSRIQLPSGKTKIVKVFWVWNKRQNTIYVKSRDDAPGSKWAEGPLLKFFDDQVIPRSSTYQVSTRLFLSQVNRKAADLFDKGIGEMKGEIDAQEVNLKPSLYAVIRRKGPMEFRHEKDELGMELLKGSETKGGPQYGWVNVTRSKAKGEYSPEKLMIKYHSSDPIEQATWRKAMERIDYFAKFPDLHAEFEKLETLITASIDMFTKKHINADPRNIDKLVRSIVNDSGAKALTMTPEQVVALAEKDASQSDLMPSTPKTPARNIPAAVDAFKALVAMGATGKNKWKKADIWTWVKDAVELLGPDKTTEEYTKAVLKKATSGGTPSTPPSAPPSTPSPTPAPAPAPTPAPMPSIPEPPAAPPAPEKPKAEKYKHQIKIWKDKGQLMWSNPKGVEGPLSVKRAVGWLNDPEKHPEFAKAYKLAQKAKFKKPPGVYEFDEGKVNPFQRDNFLLY